MLVGEDVAVGTAASREACCGACAATPGCVASDFERASPMRPTFEGVARGGTCRLKSLAAPDGAVRHAREHTACHLSGSGLVEAVEVAL